MKKLSAKLLKGREALESFFTLIVLTQNFDAIDDRLQSLIGLYDFGTLILEDKIFVVGCYVDNKLVGVNYGVLDGDTFYVHVSFRRKIKDVLDLVRLSEDIAIQHLKMKKMVAMIPTYNRPSILYTLRAGFKNKGIEKGYIFFKNKELKEVYRFEKEY